MSVMARLEGLARRYRKTFLLTAGFITFHTLRYIPMTFKFRRVTYGFKALPWFLVAIRVSSAYGAWRAR